jgi:hypothetical protein
MNGLPLRKLTGLIALVVTVALIPGCSPGIDGDYKDTSGTVSIELHGGKSVTKMMGMTANGEYKVDGDTITVTPQGEQPIVLTHKSDGSLEVNNLKLTRK